MNSNETTLTTSKATLPAQKTTKILCILDGFGLRTRDANNCIANAKMPNFRKLLGKYPWTTLSADGVSVGQEEGLVGNSEVGHMNLGGLKLVPQLSFQITQSSQNGFELDKEIAPDQLIDPTKFLQNNWQVENQKINSKVIHLVGLFSTGTIHSDLRHWVGAIEAAGKAGASKIVLHIISDGRDSDRQSLVATWDYFVKTYENRLKLFENKIVLGSVGGRFFGMDRDNNWDRVLKGALPMINSWTLIGLEVPTQKTVDFENFLLDKYLVKFEENFRVKTSNFNSEKLTSETNLDSIKYFLDKISNTLSYPFQIYDENVEPVSISYSDDDLDFGSVGIDEEDTVWLLNFRTDRMKQLAQMLCDIDQFFELNLTILGMNDYGIGPEYIYTPTFKNQPVQNTLSEAISAIGKTQLHIAETEKYNHVTYFFNGGQNAKAQGEDWVVIPSNKVNSHAEMPEMKAKEITNYILESGIGIYDYIVVNYANPDMVAHTGDIKASIISLEVLDEQLGRLIEMVEEGKATLIITADHGNMEFVGEYQSRQLSPFGNDKTSVLVDTEHNANPVPLIIATSTSKVPALFDFEYAKPIDLINSDTWLNENDIPKPQLPLWIAGKILLEL